MLKDKTQNSLSRHKRSGGSLSPPKKHGLARRQFLKMAVASTAAAAFYPLLRGASSSAGAVQSQAAKVLIEDLRLDARALAGGALAGVVATPRGITLAPGRARGDYVSTVLVPKKRFTHVGLHWNAAAADGLSFEVRWSPAGADWSEWETVETEVHAPRGTGGETFGALIRVDSATRIQFRAEFAIGRFRPLLHEATATLLNTKDGPTISALEPSPAEAPALDGVTVLPRGPISEGVGARITLCASRMATKRTEPKFGPACTCRSRKWLFTTRPPPITTRTRRRLRKCGQSTPITPSRLGGAI